MRSISRRLPTSLPSCPVAHPLKIPVSFRTEQPSASHPPTYPSSKPFHSQPRSLSSARTELHQAAAESRAIILAEIEHKVCTFAHQRGLGPEQRVELRLQRVRGLIGNQHEVEQVGILLLVVQLRDVAGGS